MSSDQRPAPAALRVCHVCHQMTLVETTRERSFRPLGKPLTLKLLTSRCTHCNAEAPSATQHQENLRRLAERKAFYGGLLLGEEIGALRRRYGLTQEQAGRIFGVSGRTFARYEQERSYPDQRTVQSLVKAWSSPSALKQLADQAGVEIPLWHERQQDLESNAVRPSHQKSSTERCL